MTTSNYTYHNLEIARNKFSPRKQMFPNHSAKKTSVEYDSPERPLTTRFLCGRLREVRLYNLNLFDCDTEHKFCWWCF